MTEQIVKRDNSFDALRGIAILCVVAIHSIVLPGRTSGWGAASFWTSVFFRQMLNFAVPAFLFVSGYFCARGDVFSGGGGYPQFLKKRIPRVLIPYLVWSLILLIGFPLIKSDRVSWSEIPYKLLTGGASGPYYFVLLIIQFYLITPLLLRVTKFGWKGGSVVLGINAVALGYFYLCRFVFHIALSFELYALPAYFWIIFYYSGLYLGQNKTVESRLAIGLKRWVLLAAFFFLASCLEAGIIIKTTRDIYFATGALRPLCFAFSFSVIAVFFGIKSRVKAYPRMLLMIGDYSFGIYLIHMIVLSKLISRLPALPTVYLVVVTVLICMCIGYSARKVLGKKISAIVFGL